MAVPRDLIIAAEGNMPSRAAMTLRTGPQTTVDAISHSLGIGIDHCVLIGMDGLRRLVDAAGGIAINVDAPIRDVITGLSVTHCGSNHLDGDQALAYARSRHVESLENGQWQPRSTPAEDRSNHAVEVLTQLGSRLRLRAKKPLKSARSLWVLAGAVTIDRGATPLVLLELARAVAHLDHAPVEVLPATLHPTEVPTAYLDPDAQSVLSVFSDA